MALFNEILTEDYIRGFANGLRKEINSLDEDDIINYKPAFVEKLIEKYKIDTTFSIDKIIKADFRTAKLENSISTSTQSGKVEVIVVDYVYNISGNSTLLSLKPSIYSNYLFDVRIFDNAIKITVDTDYDDPNLNDQQLNIIKGKRDLIIRAINDHVNNVIKDCEAFNKVIEEEILNLIEIRKNAIIQHRDIKNKLI